MKNFQIPISIIIAGAIVAGAVILSNDQGGGNVFTTNGSGHSGGMQGGNTNSQAALNARPVEEDKDHILGSFDAKVVIVEYSDFECPFCARFHPTLKQIIDDFGGEVAWVYRHFPLTSIHPKATSAAVASECIAELGGNDAFWRFTDEAFKNQRSMNDEFYKNTAESFGIDGSAFEECFKSGRYSERVQEDLENALSSGGRGTPYSIVINGEGELFPFSGALPYESVRGIVEAALNNS